MNPIETLQQAMLELWHCIEAGPQWFTGGSTARLMHARIWMHKADVALESVQRPNPLILTYGEWRPGELS
jgi:hypothetical protein